MSLVNPKYAGLVSSLLLHSVIVFAIILAVAIHGDSDQMYGRGGNYQVDMLGGGFGTEEKSIVPPSDEKTPEEQPDADASTGQTDAKPEQIGDGGGVLAGLDTTGLPGQYAEPTLHVRIRYPVGWSFMDQNKKNKLDGVTFLGPPTTSGAIPYIHVDVQDKYIFNPSRYKMKSEEKNYIMYFNGPEMLEGQYTQTIYIRTETEQDYSIKLIVKGESDFREFQPVFLAMIKTFKFGNL
jgi:hypothetical protein